MTNRSSVLWGQNAYQLSKNTKCLQIGRSEKGWFVTSDGSFLNDSFILNEEQVISGSDSFSHACATSYRFCTGISSPVLSLLDFSIRSFISWLTQYEPESELISSSLESSGLSRSFITWQPCKLNQCSMSRKANWLVHLLSLRVWVVRSSRDSPASLTNAVWAGKRTD